MVLGDAVITLKDAFPLIGVVIGGVLTITGGFFSNLYLERNRIAEDRRNLAQEFSGENSALRKIIEVRKYREGLQQAISHMQSTGQAHHLSIHVRRRYFNVYEKNVSRIGMLEGPLPSMIAIFTLKGIQFWRILRISETSHS